MQCKGVLHDTRAHDVHELPVRGGNARLDTMFRGPTASIWDHTAMRTAAFLLSLTVMFVAFGSSGPLHAQSSTTGLHKAEDKSVTVPALGITVDDLEDMNIYSSDDEKIGEVDDVLVDSSAKPVAVSAEVGGFLGLGEKDVVIDLSQFTKDGDHLRTSMTKEQIKELPEMDD